MATKKKSKKPVKRLDYEALGHLRQVQLAKILGVSGPAITKWGKRGCPRNEDKSYDLMAVTTWIRKGGIDLRSLPQSAVLEVMGTTKPTIAAWAGRGCPRKPGGRYDLPAVVKWRFGELEGRIASVRQQLSQGRTRREMAQAELAEILLAERRGELLPRGPVVAGWIARYQVLKSMLLSHVRKCGGQYGLDADQVRHISGDVETMLDQLGRAQPALQLSRAEAKVLRGTAPRATKKRKGARG